MALDLDSAINQNASNFLRARQGERALGATGTLGSIAQSIATHGASAGDWRQKWGLDQGQMAAAQSGLTIPPDVVKKADRVIP